MDHYLSILPDTKPLTFPTGPENVIGDVAVLIFLETCLVNAMRGHNLSTDTVLRATALLMESRKARDEIYKSPEWAAAFA